MDQKLGREYVFVLGKISWDFRRISGSLWGFRVISSHRKNVVGFAGAERLDAPENIRSMLIQQYRESPSNCRILDCRSRGCDRPEEVVQMFMESEFCLQPLGDSPTRKSLFDSLVSGCIPEVFDPFTAYYQYPWHLPEDRGRYSVYVDQEEVRQGKANVVERLRKVLRQEKEDTRSHIMYELLPGLVYGDSDSQFNKFKDAFGIAVDNLLERVSKL
ncbi:hypothetical protein MLD38_027781 [Melastoma candidum]|uniref:Uncharacterized protein n=1 Tax=Melastoma candidum TaxID=119954 RepID=A0ACB9P391_9MYRT|nr:hypothetical protein MLD38_027781 [Melastoma candidum]